MADRSVSWEPVPAGLSTDSLVVREFDRPTVISNAVMMTIMEAVDRWPTLSDSPPVVDYVDVDQLDGLFKTRAVDDTGHIPSVEFRFQGALVTVLYASTVRVIIERDT